MSTLALLSTKLGNLIFFSLSSCDNSFDPGISLVVLFCTFPIAIISVFRDGHNTQFVYSRCGLSSDLNSGGNISSSRNLNHLLIFIKILFAFFILIDMYSLTLSLLLIVTPTPVADSACCRAMSLYYTGDYTVQIRILSHCTC